MSDHILKDDDLDRAAAALKRKLRGPDASFDDRVMARVRAEAQPARAKRGLLRLLEPRQVRVSPAWLPLAAAALFAVWFAGTRFGARRLEAPAIAATAPRSDTVYVRFELRAPGARAVHLAGDFTEWRPDSIALTRDPDGSWSVTLPLVVGQHAYQFVVDGERWVTDPHAGTVDDGFGGRNSVIVVGPKGVVRS